MKPFRLNPEKNQQLKSERGIAFEQITVAVETNGLMHALNDPNQAKNPNYRIRVVGSNGYACLVPFVEEADRYSNEAQAKAPTTFSPRTVARSSPARYDSYFSFLPECNALDALLDVYKALRSPLPWACASLAATAFGHYRGRGGLKQVTLPDFFIGAHATVSNLRVLTWDATRYKRCFARLVVLVVAAP